MYTVPNEISESMINELDQYVGKMFSDNFSNTGNSLCLKIDKENNKVYYQEVYSEYSNFTGKNAYGNPRTDELHHPTPGLNTMSLRQFYGCAIGWI